MRSIFCWCLLCFTFAAFIPGAKAASPKPFAVTVALREQTGTLSPLLFGSNLQWTDRGDSLLAKDGSLHAARLKAIQGMAVPLLRFPGGLLSSSYRWQDGIGPARGVGLDYSGKQQPMAFGTDEYLDLLARMDAQGMITVNLNTPAEESAAWLRYVKEHARTSSPRLRVPWWEIGNESYLKGDPSFVSAAEYVKRFKAHREKLKEADPKVQVGAILEGNLLGVPWARTVVPEHKSWNNTVIQGTKGVADFYAIHLYGPFDTIKNNDAATRQMILATPAILEHKVQAMALILQKEKITAPLLVTEYNMGFANARDAWKYSTAPFEAAYIADMLITFARNKIGAACIWSLIGNHNFGMVESSDKPKYRPSGRLFAELRPLHGASLLHTTVDAPRLQFQKSGILTKTDTAAAASALGLATKEGIVLLAVNRSTTRPAAFRATFEGVDLSVKEIRILGVPEKTKVLPGQGKTAKVPAASAVLIVYAKPS